MVVLIGSFSFRSGVRFGGTRTGFGVARRSALGLQSILTCKVLERGLSIDTTGFAETLETSRKLTAYTLHRVHSYFLGRAR